MPHFDPLLVARVVLELLAEEVPEEFLVESLVGRLLLRQRSEQKLWKSAHLTIVEVGMSVLAEPADHCLEATCILQGTRQFLH